MKYYLLTRSLKRKDVGVAFGQTKEFWDGAVGAYGWQNLLEAMPEYHGNLKNDRFPDFEPRIKFELSEKGKLSDLVGVPNMVANGMLVSPKFKALLEQFDLMEHRFYEGQIKTGVFFREYFWFHPLSEHAERFVDFENSIFKETNGNLVKLKSLKDSLGYYSKHNVSIDIYKIVLKENSKHIDLFYIPYFQFSTEFFISEPLMKAIKKEKITGIEIKEQDILGDL